jgi:hypothetical protein
MESDTIFSRGEICFLLRSGREIDDLLPIPGACRKKVSDSVFAQPEMVVRKPSDTKMVV